MSILLYGIAGLAAGILVVISPARPAWSRAAGFALGVGVVALVSGISGFGGRPEALALLLGLGVPMALDDPRVGGWPLAIGVGAASAVALASDMLLTLLVFAAVGASALHAILRQPATSSTSKE